MKYHHTALFKEKIIHPRKVKFSSWLFQSFGESAFRRSGAVVGAFLYLLSVKFVHGLSVKMDKEAEGVAEQEEKCSVFTWS